MIDLRNGTLLDLFGVAGVNADPALRSLSYALRRGMDLLMDAAGQLGIYYRIDALNEATLDYLALELRSMYYSEDLPIDQKRTIVRNTILWYMKAGTTSAVEEMLTVIFGGGSVTEWYNTTGLDAGEFTVEADVLQAGSSADMISSLRSILYKVKNERSHLGKITVVTDAETYPAPYGTVDATCSYTQTIRSGVGRGYQETAIPFLGAGSGIFYGADTLHISRINSFSLTDTTLTAGPDYSSVDDATLNITY